MARTRTPKFNDHGVADRPSDNGIPNQPDDNGVPNQPHDDNGVPNQPNDNGVPNQPNDDNGVPNQPPVNGNGIPNQPNNDNGVPNQPNDGNGVPNQPTVNDDGQPGRPEFNDNGVPNQPNDNGVPNQPNNNGVPNQPDDNGVPNQPHFNDDGHLDCSKFNWDDVQVGYDPGWGNWKYVSKGGGPTIRVPRTPNSGYDKTGPSKVVKVKVNKHRLKYPHITRRTTRSLARLPGTAPLVQLSYVGRVREVRQRTRYLY